MKKKSQKKTEKNALTEVGTRDGKRFYPAVEIIGKEEKKKRIVRSLATGAVAGFLNGLFGGGGGMVVVPMLIGLLGYPPKKAHATAIPVILPLSVVSGLLYAVFGNVSAEVLWPVSAGVFAGGLLGALLLKKIPTKSVVLIFSLAMLVAGVRMLFS